jgi:RND family efflux transporter MFP subunit
MKGLVHRAFPGWFLLGLGMSFCGGCQQGVAVGPSDQARENSAGDAPVAVTVATVQTRTVQRKIAVVGTLFGFEEFTVTPKVEGRVESIACEVGDRVKPGAVLLNLDSTDYRLAVDEAQRAVEQELAKLGLTQPPDDDFDIENIPGVLRARLVVENAQRKFDREKKLIATNVSTRENYEQIESELKVASATLQQARLEVKATLAAVKHRLAVLAQARQRLAETRVLAPQLPSHTAPGVMPTDYVVSRRMVAVGDMVRAFPSTPVFQLVLDTTLKLKATVPERYSAEVQVGQPVELQVEAYPAEVFVAHISRVNPTVDPANRTFEIEALVTNTDHRLKPGSFAKADILTRTESEALTAPLESVVTFAGVNKVFVIQDDKAREVEVTIGLRGRDWVELLGDLQSGDRLVTSGHSQLADGTTVRIRDDKPPEPAARATTR